MIEFWDDISIVVYMMLVHFGSYRKFGASYSIDNRFALAREYERKPFFSNASLLMPIQEYQVHDQ